MLQLSYVFDMEKKGGGHGWPQAAFLSFLS